MFRYQDWVLKGNRRKVLLPGCRGKAENLALSAPHPLTFASLAVAPGGWLA